MRFCFGVEGNGIAISLFGMRREQKTQDNETMLQFFYLFVFWFPVLWLIVFCLCSFHVSCLASPEKQLEIAFSLLSCFYVFSVKPID